MLSRTICLLQRLLLRLIEFGSGLLSCLIDWLIVGYRWPMGRILLFRSVADICSEMQKAQT